MGESSSPLLFAASDRSSSNLAAAPEDFARNPALFSFTKGARLHEDTATLFPVERRETVHYHSIG